MKKRTKIGSSLKCHQCKHMEWEYWFGYRLICTITEKPVWDEEKGDYKIPLFCQILEVLR